MASGAVAPQKAADPTAPAQAGPRWLLLGLALLLVALAVFQSVYLVPRCLVVVQSFVGHWVPAPLRLLSAVPEWAALVAGFVLGAVAVWQRGSPHRISLLMTVAVAANVGISLAVVNGLLRALPSGGQ